MDESISAAETSIASRKRRGKYCAAFGCNNSAYDADGMRTSYHFFEFPKGADRRNRLCTLIGLRSFRQRVSSPTTSSLILNSIRQRQRECLNRTVLFIALQRSLTRGGVDTMEL